MIRLLWLDYLATLRERKTWLCVAMLAYALVAIPRRARAAARSRARRDRGVVRRRRRRSSSSCTCGST